MYLKVSGSNIIYPYSVQQLKMENKNVSFPSIISNELLATFNVYPVKLVDAGFDDDYTKDVVEINPTLSGSEYVQTYQISDADEITITTRKEIKWEEIRETRNNLLKDCDWTQFQDSPITGSKLTEWQTYRQSLRDVTSQENPYNITWPTKPE
jgi:hypothetical protein